MEKNIALIPGDGIGPDVVAEAVKVLDAVGAKFGHKWNYTNVIAGGAAIDKWGKPLPQDQLDICLKSDAVLLGAVGGPKWDDVAPEIRPEKALLGLRGGRVHLRAIKSLVSKSCGFDTLCGISVLFRTLFPSQRQVTHALLTRPPLN